MPAELLTSLLRDVSRSFYLTMRALPGAVRPQISLAYLLARATDTLADTEVVAPERRLEALSELRGRILGTRAAPVDFGGLAQNQSLPAEKILLERCEEAIAVLQSFSAADQRRIREVLDVITSGQELDLRRFGHADKDHIIALAGREELDDYTYRVAGCVGEFWTGVCRAGLFPDAPLDDAALLRDGARFGKGLQMVNILRDLPADLRKGRCYIPLADLRGIGLEPARLLDPGSEPAFRPVYNALLDVAGEHLRAGWDYVNALPFWQARARLACAWPVLLGAGTLRKLRAEPVLDPGHRVKVSRSEVRRVLAGSVLRYAFRGAWDRQFSQALGRP